MTDAAQKDAAWASVKRAIDRVRQGLPPDERCVFCGGALRVEALPPSWIFGCPCGKSNGTLKGL